MKLETQSNYVSNPQFVGAVYVVPTSGSTFNAFNGDNPQFGFVAGGLYVGQIGDLVVKTYDNSVVNFVSASGFIPGAIAAVSASSTCGNILALR